MQTPDELTDPLDFVRRTAPLDLVADVLAAVRLSGAIFLRAEYTAPWAYESAPCDDLVELLQLRRQRLILFHIISEGQCWLRLRSGEQLQVSAGEVVILPYGHVHTMSSMSSAQPWRPVPITSVMPSPPWGPFSMINSGSGGARTSVVCGYLQCDDPIFEPVMGTLPPLFSVRPPAGPAAAWVAASIQYALDASTAPHPTRQSVAVRLPELVFSEMLRLYVESKPQLETGWLAALRDPVVGPALLELHAEPSRKWTVEELARRVASSRSTLNERFSRLLGRAPMQYLSEWRLQVAAGLLRSTTLSAALVAYRVGYESEAAFNRAFKRALGSPPAQWRQRAVSA
ncbi:MAG TPA: AraC family transcriptional regulator [Ktedonobacterales bacterium]|nr:AraC family transcriptional regulator [Ktedonobacterales bacterium]